MKLRYLIAGLLGLSSLEAGSPNILFILSDDLSWTDPACYGNELFETPNIDRLSAEGMRFTRAYSPAPICSASRAGILTGKTPARLGFEFVTKNKPGFQPVKAPLRSPPFTLNLDLDEVTLPEMLTPSGYRSGFYGKWHLNQHHKKYLGWSPTHGPPSQGFRESIEEFGSHPYQYWNRKPERTYLDLKDGEFPIDKLTNHAIDFIKQKHPAPFFCMVSHFYVHDPIHTRIKGLNDHYLAKIPDTHPRKDVVAQYGAMVTSLDHYIGELLKGLEESGKADSTIVIFTSDNGGHPNYAGNAPLRGSKWNLYEGGIRVPFVAKWKGQISPGSISDHPVTSLDLFATFAELAGADSSTAGDSRSLLPIFKGETDIPGDRSLFWHFPYYHPERGFDEAPQTIGIDDGVTSQTRPHSAIRKGEWKLIWFQEDNRTELYHLAEDPNEAANLSDQRPRKRIELLNGLKSYLKESGARMPEANPDYSTADQ